MKKTRKATTIAKDSAHSTRFLNFVNQSPSPFHAVQTASAMLSSNGFSKCSETTPFESEIKPNNRLFFTRNQSTLFAIAVGGQYKPGNGVIGIGAHTDSPCLRVKPISTVSKHGCEQIGVETYGGGLWNTWFDRDLSVAGRMIIDQNGSFESRLVRIDRPLMNIPSLAIHLNRNIYSDGFKPNFETELVPLIATLTQEKLNSSSEKKARDSRVASDNHSAGLMKLLAAEAGVDVESIRDFELSLYDTNASCLGGIENEFIYSPRLDNLCSSYCATAAMVEALPSLSSSPNIWLVCLFDHEEVGSSSFHGAGSNMFASVIQRIISGDHNTASLAIRNSFLVSADMAHAVHPNYSAKHEDKHRPEMHKGVVIKYNSKQRYATNSTTSFIVKEVARRNDLPIQEFVVRNDMGCGSTIGPILAANTGIRTVDVGIAQLGMHSIRETCGTRDLEHCVELFKGIFKQFHSIDSVLKID